MNMNKKLAAGLVILVLAATARAEDTGWIGTWGASPLPPTAANGPFPASPSFHDQTIRQVVRISAGGRRVRLRLSNEYGKKPLEIGAVTIALADGKGGIVPGTEHTVTFGGQSAAVIAADAPLLSDPVDLSVQPLAKLSISLYLPGDTGPCTCHSTGRETAFVSKPGDFTHGPFEPASTMTARAFLTGIDVEASGPQHVVVAFGDSITDGVGATLNEDRRWPDDFAARLAARQGGGSWGVVNEGISGNQVLSDGAGQSALARFDRDVLAVPGVTHVIVFEGINDIGIAFGHFGRPGAPSFRPASKVSAETLIAGYRQIIARAHLKGIKVYAATITPFEGAAYYSDKGETVREAVNRWIRTSHEFDGVIDFDAVLRDPKDPKRIAEGLHAGDHLHGSDKGYREMADSIDLGLFR